MGQIWSLRKGAPTPPPNTVRVDRRSAWGNSTEMRRESERAEACRAFRVYAVARLAAEPTWLDSLIDAARPGWISRAEYVPDIEFVRDMACWCQWPGQANPKECHAQTLIALTLQRIYELRRADLWPLRAA